MTLIEKLAKARKDAGLSQSKLGEKLGATKQYISNVEMGRTPLSDEKARLWAEFCGVELVVYKDIRPILQPPTDEAWYMVRPLGSPDFQKLYWLDGFDKFVDEIKDTYDIMEGLDTWEIEEWKILAP